MTSPSSIADNRCSGCNGALIYVTNIGWICNNPDDCDRKGIQE